MKKARLLKTIFAIGICVLGLTQSGLAWNVENGIGICTISKTQSSPQIVSDTHGGAVITWLDTRNDNSDIYAQAVDSTGAIKWTSNGVAICTASGNQTNFQAVSDGRGGAIIAWEDYRNGNGDIYAQAIDSAGVVRWIVNGVPVCTVSGNQSEVSLISDDQWGAIITWTDARNGESGIYAQADYYHRL